MESPRSKTVSIVTLGRSRASASAVSVTVGRPPQHSSFRNNGTKQGNESTASADNQLTLSKVHVRGLLFSRAPKHERIHLCSKYASRSLPIQFMPPNSLSAPSAERDATRKRRCKASRGATVNCCNHRSSNRRSRPLAEAFHPKESSASRASN